MNSDQPVDEPVDTPVQKPGVISGNTHVIPLLILAVALLAAIVTLTLFSKLVDPHLYDGLTVCVGAIAGVTWVNHSQ